MIATLPRRAVRLPRPTVALVLLVVLLLSSVADTIFDKQRQLNGLNDQILAAKTRLRQLVDQEKAVRAQIVALDNQLAYVAAQIEKETARLELLRSQVEATKLLLAQKEAELAQHIADLSKRMRVMYKRGQVSGLELMLSAGNFTDLLNRVFFFNDIIRDDRRQMDLLRQERAAIQELKADLDAKHAQQAAVVKSIQDQRAQLEAVRAQRLAAQQRIQALEAAFQRELDDMEAQRAAVQAQIARLLQESLRARSSGRWIWPVDGVITQGFGCSPYAFEPYDPSCPTHHFHSGVDIANDIGTPIHASDGGFVHNFTMGCSWNPGLLCGYGRYVIVVHAGGFTSLYGHLSGWAVADGTEVPKDQVIGYMGSTGASTGSHLHFEIELGGVPVNPLAYLP